MTPRNVANLLLHILHAITLFPALTLTVDDAVTTMFSDDAPRTSSANSDPLTVFVTLISDSVDDGDWTSTVTLSTVKAATRANWKYELVDVSNTVTAVRGLADKMSTDSEQIIVGPGVSELCDVSTRLLQQVIWSIIFI